MTDTMERERRVEAISPGEEVPPEVTGNPAEAPSASGALQASARRRASETVRRLAEAIHWLEAHDEPVSLPAVNRISGLDPKTIYRNPKACALFQAHSTHLNTQREREEAERKRKRRRGRNSGRAVDPDVDASPTAPSPTPSTVPTTGALLALPRKQLAARLEAALAARDETRRECAELEVRYTALLQEHMGCAQTILTLRAELDRRDQFQGRYHTLLEHQEHH
jgi:hypothetical protein